MLLQGQQSRGIAMARMVKDQQKWAFLDFEVDNLTEDHWIDLSAGPPLATKEQLHGQGRIYLLALGAAANDDVRDLSAFLKDDLGVPVQVLPPIDPPAEAYDPVRKQWIAEMLTDAMAARFPNIDADEDGSIIGVTSEDVYIRSFDWPLAYNYRKETKYAVLPAARLNPAFYKLPASSAIARQRLHKVAMKILGQIYFGFHESSDPHSVTAFERTLRAIDRMRDFYLQSDVQGQTISPDDEGFPCLNFTRANVMGLPRLKPIQDCMKTYGDQSLYQIDLLRGEFRVQRKDLDHTGPLSMHLTRLYGAGEYAPKSRGFGKQTWDTFEDTIWSTDPQSIQTINIGARVFRRITPGVGFSPTAQFESPNFSSSGGGALLTYDKGHWRVQDEDGNEWHYLVCTPNSAIDCFFKEQLNVNGDRVEVQRDVRGHILKVLQKTNPLLPTVAAYDDTWTFAYDGDLIQSITDQQGSVTHYRYDTQGFLTDVEGKGGITHYGYDEAHRMNLVVEDGVTLRIHYNSQGRPDQLDFPDNTAYHLTYGSNTVDVAGPGGRWSVQIQPGNFSVTPVN